MLNGESSLLSLAGSEYHDVFGSLVVVAGAVVWGAALCKGSVAFAAGVGSAVACGCAGMIQG